MVVRTSTTLCANQCNDIVMPLYVCRRLVHLEGLEKPIIVALYEKMHLTMAESERVKPLFVEIAESLV